MTDELKIVRDLLNFDDSEWYRDLDDQLFTLDSASTFIPITNDEQEKAEDALKHAVQTIQVLTDAKLKASGRDL